MLVSSAHGRLVHSARTYDARASVSDGGTLAQARTRPGHGTTAESGVGGGAADKQTYWSLLSRPRPSSAEIFNIAGNIPKKLLIKAFIL